MKEDYRIILQILITSIEKLDDKTLDYKILIPFFLLIPFGPMLIAVSYHACKSLLGLFFYFLVNKSLN